MSAPPNAKFLAHEPLPLRYAPFAHGGISATRGSRPTESRTTSRNAPRWRNGHPSHADPATIHRAWTLQRRGRHPPGHHNRTRSYRRKAHTANLEEADATLSIGSMRELLLCVDLTSQRRLSGCGENILSQGVLHDGGYPSAPMAARNASTCAPMSASTSGLIVRTFVFMASAP